VARATRGRAPTEHVEVAFGVVGLFEVVARIGKAVREDVALGMWCVKGPGNYRVYSAGSYKSRGTRCAAARAEREGWWVA